MTMRRELSFGMKLGLGFAVSVALTVVVAVLGTTTLRDNAAIYDELLDVVDRIGASGDDVWVMPQGSTIEAMDAADKPSSLRSSVTYAIPSRIACAGMR